MSHYVVMVIGEDPETLLEPFYEGIEVETYIEKTKEDIIAEKHRQIEDIVQEFKNKVLLIKNLDYSQLSYNLGSVLDRKENDYLNILRLSDEEYYQYEIKGRDVDHEGNVLSTYNPDSKWDWYDLGGRWPGLIKTSNGTCNQAYRGEILNWDEVLGSTFAFLSKDGWIEPGQMGWFATVLNERDTATWETERDDFLRSIKNDELISIYDCHI